MLGPTNYRLYLKCLVLDSQANTLRFNTDVHQYNQLGRQQEKIKRGGGTNTSRSSQIWQSLSQVKENRPNLPENAPNLGDSSL